jgi:hypothetical protein
LSDAVIFGLYDIFMDFSLSTHWGQYKAVFSRLFFRHFPTSKLAKKTSVACIRPQLPARFRDYLISRQKNRGSTGGGFQFQIFSLQFLIAAISDFRFARYSSILLKYNSHKSTNFHSAVLYNVYIFMVVYTAPQGPIVLHATQGCCTCGDLRLKISDNKQGRKSQSVASRRCLANA